MPTAPTAAKLQRYAPSTMSRPSKEVKERAFFQRFKKAVSELDEYSVAEQESPDFLLTSEQKVIGIEIRQLLLSGDLKAKESLENRIVAAARKRYEKENLPPLQVTFQFKSHLSISKHEQQDVGNAVGNVIAQKMRKGGEVGVRCSPKTDPVRMLVGCSTQA